MTAIPSPHAATHARPANDSPWMTLAEAALYAKCSVGYLRSQARSGRLRTTLVGRHHRTHREWLDAFLGYNAAQAPPP